ncbi:MAG: hypothetical protein LC723_00325 [Actinobacteria bacterium]|nr:hypothetical protein [Actinomycetota bacterium]
MGSPRKIAGITTALAVLVALGIAAPSNAFNPVPIDASSPVRSGEPVVLAGQQFPIWSAGPEIAVREPQPANDPAGIQSQCASGGKDAYSDGKDHNCNQDPRLRVGDGIQVNGDWVIRGARPGADVNKLLGYRWNGKRFVQIPFQVDQRFTRYLTNNNSGFAFYSGADQHTTYAYDREGWRFTDSSASDPCTAAPREGVAGTTDPIPGLDDNDELAFMYSDAAEKAPAGADIPSGIAGSQEVKIVDPITRSVRYVYVMLSADHGPKPAFDSTNGYVRYTRDTDANQYLFSQSSYDNYGATLQGPYYDPATGTCITSPAKQRRPRDTAWIRTNRYSFRYDGRWLLTELHVSAPDSTNTALGSTDSWRFGPDLIDQWKARAFQQRPGGVTPCCGYEEEVNNWGGSSILLGERTGPVRAMRETWGADSATNNIRRETFYRDEIRQQNYLRVHVIPPFDGIYVQWDYNAGKVSRYSNPYRPEGVAIDGKNDEVFGNANAHIAQDRAEFKDQDSVPITGPIDVSQRLQGADADCKIAGQKGICNDLDFSDPTFSGPHGLLSWEKVAGPYMPILSPTSLPPCAAGIRRPIPFLGEARAMPGGGRATSGLTVCMST